MSSITLSTNSLTAGYVDDGLTGPRKFRTFRQRVNVTGAAAYVTLAQNLPGRANIVWAEILTNTAVQVTGNDATSTANCYALVMYPTTATAAVTAPPSTATQSNPTGTNGQMVLISGGLTTALTDGARGSPLAFGTTKSNRAENIYTSPALLVLQPAFTNSNRVYPNGTSGFVFGTATNQSATAGVVDILLEYEEHDAPPGSL